MDKVKINSPKIFDEYLDRLDIQPILASKVRRVKWLYNNSNRNTLVYDEKMVRLIVHRMQQRIDELEYKLTSLQTLKKLSHEPVNTTK